MKKRYEDAGEGRIYDHEAGRVCYIVPVSQMKLSVAAAYMEQLLALLNKDTMQ